MSKKDKLTADSPDTKPVKKKRSRTRSARHSNSSSSPISIINSRKRGSTSSELIKQDSPTASSPLKGRSSPRSPRSHKMGSMKETKAEIPELPSSLPTSFPSSIPTPFRPGFKKEGSNIELSRKRMQSEIESVGKLIDSIYPILQTEEGLGILSSVDEQMQLYIGSFTQTQENIRLLLESFMENGVGDDNTISNLIQMNEEIEILKKRYEQIRPPALKTEQISSQSSEIISGYDEDEVPQLSVSQLKELLDQANIDYRQCIEKSELEELVRNYNLFTSEESEESNDDGELYYCKICFDELPKKQMYSLIKCGHQNCKQCLRDYIQTKVDDGAVLSIDCPDPDCKLPLDVEDIALIVPPSLARRYDQLKILAELNMNPNCRWCPRPGCNTAMIGDPTEEKLTCSQCAQEICFNCKHIWHEGKTCEEFEIWRKQNDTEEQCWDEWAKENGAKQCPKCGVWIVRPTGCNQVICKSCGFSFCWLCLKECIVPDHYKYGECAGKWFEDTQLTTGQKIVGGIILGGVLVLASPLLVLAGGIYLGKKVKRKVSRRKAQEIEYKKEDQEGENT